MGANAGRTVPGRSGNSTLTNFTSDLALAPRPTSTDLESEDIRQALQYAANLAREETYPLRA